jgi:hypothetical protein
LAERRWTDEKKQEFANSTLEKVDKLFKKILNPLLENQDTANLYKELVGSIDKWKEDKMKIKWYSSVIRKNETLSELDEILNSLVSNFSTAIDGKLKDLVKEKNKLDRTLTANNENIIKAEKKLKSFDQEINELLPSWLRDLAPTNRVIQLLPLFLIGSAIYVLFIGLDLTRHYQIYVKGKAFSQDIVSDPSMSSTWTLIPRGRYGTIFTIAAYAIFFLLIWVLLEESVILLEKWIEIGKSGAWITDKTAWEVFRWICRLILVGVISYACIQPWRSNSFDKESRLLGSGAV